MNKMQVIRTERLCLQELQAEDREWLILLTEDEYLQAQYAEGLKNLKKISNDFDAYLHSVKRIWTIRPGSEKDKVIGVCSIDHWDQINRTFEIEGALLSMYWNKQIMAEALQALMQYIESRKEVHAFVSSVSVFNERAIRLAGRLGFHKVGCLSHELIMAKTTSVRQPKDMEATLLYNES